MVPLGLRSCLRQWGECWPLLLLGACEPCWALRPPWTEGNCGKISQQPPCAGSPGVFWRFLGASSLGSEGLKAVSAFAGPCGLCGPYGRGVPVGFVDGCTQPPLLSLAFVEGA